MKPAFEYVGPVRDRQTFVVAPALGRPSAKGQAMRAIAVTRETSCDCCATVEEFVTRHLPEDVPE